MGFKARCCAISFWRVPSALTAKPIKERRTRSENVSYESFMLMWIRRRITRKYLFHDAVGMLITKPVFKNFVANFLRGWHFQSCIKLRSDA